MNLMQKIAERRARRAGLEEGADPRQAQSLSGFECPAEMTPYKDALTAALDDWKRLDGFSDMFGNDVKVGFAPPGGAHPTVGRENDGVTMGWSPKPTVWLSSALDTADKQLVVKIQPSDADGGSLKTSAQIMVKFADNSGYGQNSAMVMHGAADAGHAVANVSDWIVNHVAENAPKAPRI